MRAISNTAANTVTRGKMHKLKVIKLKYLYTVILGMNKLRNVFIK